MSSVVTRSSVARGGLSVQDHRVLASTLLMPPHPAGREVMCRHFLAERGGRFCGKPCHTATQKQLERCNTHQRAAEHEIVAAFLEARRREHQDAVEAKCLIELLLRANAECGDAVLSYLQEKYGGRSVLEIYEHACQIVGDVQAVTASSSSSSSSSSAVAVPSRRRLRSDDFGEVDGECAAAPAFQWCPAAGPAPSFQMWLAGAAFPSVSGDDANDVLNYAMD